MPKSGAKDQAAKKPVAKKSASKTPRAAKAAKEPTPGTKVSRAKRAMDKRKVATGQMVVEAIEHVATDIMRNIERGRQPKMTLPLRSLSNVHYDKKRGYFEIGDSTKVRTLTVNTVKTFAQSLRMMSLSKELVQNDDFATKRDAYYQSKNWGECRFKEQVESDTVMDDIEAMFSVQNVNREQLRFVPEQHGGAVAGDLIVIDRDLETGEDIRIDCTRFGSGAYSVPSWVEQLRFETSAKFILAIETHGMFQRLQSHKYWKDAQCILVSLSGVPSRACRRFIRRLADSHNLPVYAFTDCDPYGISNIYRTLKVGSGNSAHINRFFCVPQATFLGLTPDDIIEWDLRDATHKLTDIDIKRARDALKNDPFFLEHKRWRQALEKLVKSGVRAEQQALSKHGLNFVIDEYLPSKLAHVDRFLP